MHHPYRLPNPNFSSLSRERVWEKGVVDDVIKIQNSPIELKIGMESTFDMDITK